MGHLIEFDAQDKGHINLTYRLLLERYVAGYVNIPGETPEHVPTLLEHALYLQGADFECAYLWEEDGCPVGFGFMRPLGMAHEIGVFVLREFCGQGIGTAMMQATLRRHPECKRIVARINPQNLTSNRMFERLGFQHTCNVWALEQLTTGDSA